MPIQIIATLPLTLAQLELELPSPYNWIGLGVASAIALIVLAIVGGLYSKLGARPVRTQMPPPGEDKFKALPKPSSEELALPRPGRTSR